MVHRKLSQLLLMLAVIGAIGFVLLATKQTEIEGQSDSSTVFLSPIKPTAAPTPKHSTHVSLAMEYVSKAFQISMWTKQATYLPDVRSCPDLLLIFGRQGCFYPHSTR